MFLSKIWFAVVAMAAVVGISVALVMPRPAERKVLEAEDRRLAQARRDVSFYLELEARNRIDTALGYTRLAVYNELKKVKEEGESDKIAAQLHDSARSTLDQLLAGTNGRKPVFIIALDAWGRVVARAGQGDKDWGDDLSGFFLVRDALRGLMRDDLWLLTGKLYRVAAAPVIARPVEPGVDPYVGAIVVGWEVDESLAKELETRVSSHCDDVTTGAGCDTHVAFFARNEVMANSGPTTLAGDIKAEAQKHEAELDARDEKGQTKPVEPFTINGDAQSWRVSIRRLPGEVGAQGGFYAVYSERPRAVSFAGTLKSVVKEDISFKNFPWTSVGAGFLLALAAGLLLMWTEADRPLRRMLRESLALGKGEQRLFGEDRYHGKFGSIARSVNLALDKLARDKGQARSDLGALYGSDDDHGAARPLPATGPGAAGRDSGFAPPPPSDFALGGNAPTPGNQSLPHGGGFEFEIPPPPPPSASPGLGIGMPGMAPGLKATSRPAAEEMPAPDLRARATAAPPPPLPPLMPSAPPSPPTPPPRLGVTPSPSPLAGSRPAPPSTLDDDILGHQTDPGDEPTALSPPPIMPTKPPARPAARAAAAASVPAADFSGPVADPRLLAQQATADGEATYFRQVFEDFIELKRKCGESIDALTFEKFVVKLQQNRDQLVAKYNCKAVKFQVYVKDGKAALKATPVKA